MAESDAWVHRPDARVPASISQAGTFIAVALPAALAERVHSVVAARGWDQDWGPDAGALLFAHGLSALRIEHELAPLAGAPAEQLHAHAETLRRRWRGLEGDYAALKFQAFTLRRGLQLLRIRRSALANDTAGLAHRLERFARDRAVLEAEVAALRAQRAAGGVAPADAEPPPAPRSAGLLGRFRGWLRG